MLFLLFSAAGLAGFLSSTNHGISKVDIVRWRSNWILFKYFKVQQSIKFNSHLQIRHFIQLWVMHHSILFTQMKMDNIFQNGIFWYIGSEIGLMCIPPGKQSHKKFHLDYSHNSCTSRNMIFQNRISCHDTSISFLFNIPFRECHILDVVLVTKFPLFCWHISPMMNIQHTIPIRR